MKVLVAILVILMIDPLLFSLIYSDSTGTVTGGTYTVTDATGMVSDSTSTGYEGTGNNISDTHDISSLIFTDLF